MTNMIKERYEKLTVYIQEEIRGNEHLYLLIIDNVLSLQSSFHKISGDEYGAYVHTDYTFIYKTLENEIDLFPIMVSTLKLKELILNQMNSLCRSKEGCLL